MVWLFRISLSILVIYYVYQFSKSLFFIRSLDDPIRKEFATWNVGRSTLKTSGFLTTKKYHFLYDRLTTEQLNLLNTRFKSLRDTKGIVLSFSDLFFKALPIVALFVTTFSSGFQNLVKLVSENMNDDSEIIKLLEFANKTNADIMDIVINLLGFAMIIFIAGFIEMIITNNKKSSLYPRINVIEQILEYRKEKGDEPMFKKDSVLKNDIDFDNAIFFSIPIAVWQNGEILDYGGLISKHTDSSVELNGSHYLKATCEFKVR